jgi:uncharacterized protein (TIGR00288 family)
MTPQFARGPQPRSTPQPQTAPHAALLIDFDNVTMGIRSDLTKELRSLLNSDVIKGKVAVQRAYADWRRYPQYIVPLAENSVDLIFAPAYGSSKKNATDIRLAIDALELVFTRPEIGTFILLSGDSDFSSLVLKLKEYGKYVIGVGIRESSSDLLVQNCDEYYSYSGLTGLTRAGDETPSEQFDPWELVEIAIRQMTDQKDVMRSDRLKQILIELDPNFDEKALGFPKFNRFVQEAANRGLLHLKKMENGQFEVSPPEPGVPLPTAPEPEPRRPRRERTPAALPAQPAAAAPALPAEPPQPKPAPASAPTPAPAPIEQVEAKPIAASDELREAYELLQRATSDLTRGRGTPVRDSDIKRRMLELRPGFDEGVYGFSKFSRFLRQAHDADVINLNKVENGSYEVTLGAGARIEALPARADGAAAGEPAREHERGRRRGGRERGRNGREREREPRMETAAPAEPKQEGRAPSAAAAPERAPVRPAEAAPAPKPAATQEAKPSTPPAPAGTPKPPVSLGFRRGSRRPVPPAPPPILAGQTVGAPPAPAPTAPEQVAATEPATAAPAKEPKSAATPLAPGRPQTVEAEVAARGTVTVKR